MFIFTSSLKDFRPNIILEKLRNGDDSPLYELYRLYRDEFIQWSSKNFSSTSDQAKDAFQDAMIVFHQNVITGKLIDLSSTIKTYLFQIGKHKLLNIQKKESRLAYHDTLQLIQNGEMEDYMEEENKAFTQEQISSAINKLPIDCQKILKLYYFKEFDMQSIARELDYKNADTAKSKKSFCMKNLMAELKKISTIFIF